MWEDAAYITAVAGAGAIFWEKIISPFFLSRRAAKAKDIKDSEERLDARADIRKAELSQKVDVVRIIMERLNAQENKTDTLSDSIPEMRAQMAVQAAQLQALAAHVKVLEQHIYSEAGPPPPTLAWPQIDKLADDWNKP